MIAIAGEARRLVQGLLAVEGKPLGGLRITIVPDDGERDPSFELEVVDGPQAADEVQQVAELRLFLGPGAAAALDEAQLVVEEGELALALPEVTRGRR